MTTFMVRRRKDGFYLTPPRVTERKGRGRRLERSWSKLAGRADSFATYGDADNAAMVVGASTRIEAIGLDPELVSESITRSAEIGAWLRALAGVWWGWGFNDHVKALEVWPVAVEVDDGVWLAQGVS